MNSRLSPPNPTNNLPKWMSDLLLEKPPTPLFFNVCNQIKPRPLRLKSQFEGMMAQVMQQLASPTIDPSPTSRRSHSSLTESALTQYSPTPANHPHGISASLPHHSSPSQGGGSMSTASGESSDSSSFQPQAKKFRSLRTDLSQMSFDSANSEELSALGDVLYPPHHGLAPYPAPPSPSTIQQRSPSAKFPPDAQALPDSNAQYKSPSDSNGGAPS